MIVLVDNYDSFSYNLYQLLGSVEPDVRVVRNDEVAVGELAAMRPEAVVLSPGPGRPSDAGVCEEAVRALAGCVPILGVCLGHQAICEALGARVAHAARLVHGKASPVLLDTSCPVFGGLPERVMAGRYHSLAVDGATLPDDLVVVARAADDGEVMAVAHARPRVRPSVPPRVHPHARGRADGPELR